MAVRTATEILAASNGAGVSREDFVELTHALGYDDLLAREPELPVDSLRDAIPFLRRPFAPDSVRWKVASQYPKDDPRAGQVVAYIDARTVIARLNLVVADLWHDEYERMSEGLVCRLTIAGVTRRDVGDGKGKSSYSDSLKRAAVRFSIAESIYAIPAVKMQAGQGKDKLPVRGPKDKRTLRIEPDQLSWLRDRYEAWLDTIGIQAFGKPLEHGDVLGAQGDPDVPEGEPDAEPHLFEDDEPPKPTGRKISAQRATQIAQAFATKAPESVTPDDLTAKLAAVTGKPVDDQVEALKGLKESQAVEIESWVEGLSG